MNKNIFTFYNELNTKFAPNDPRIDGWLSLESYKRRIDIISKYDLQPKENDFVLDYGCGAYLSYFREFCPDNYIGVDINISSLKIASSNLKIALNNSELKDNKCLFTPDKFDEFKKNKDLKFSKIILNGVLQDCENLKEASQLILYLEKILTSDGSLLVITPSNYYFSENDNVLLISPYTFISLAEQLGREFVLSKGELKNHIIFKLSKKLDISSSEH